MPYISQLDRPEIDAILLRLPTFRNPGQLNYAITQVIQEYLGVGQVGYTAFNEVIGVLECCKLELYRRLVAPYEDQKLKENGDVY